MTIKQVLAAIRGDIDPSQQDKLFPRVAISRSVPTVTQYMIANPVSFFQSPETASQYGVDVASIAPDTPLKDLASMLPVIYLADVHPEYGTVGYQLNRFSPQRMDDVHPGLRSFRGRPIYQGGAQKKGSCFTMVHRKVGFPENRAWKGLPGNKEFRLFFSPDVAMANELCSTEDAHPSEFKMFQWASIWLPRALDMEYQRKLWITVEAPVELLFTDEETAEGGLPLYRRVLASLPAQALSLSGVPMLTSLTVSPEAPAAEA
eukprot:CAMPEP_0173191992 /NCGR_PEP_ID=MMETSP1141-20130122/13185_1 /TAXON_ID=483371 /ORGANISM="non described non described, Strain CCMP2298" /LENGTH=260 /DNA_ID=CAMNT_0014116227 /DNA_START=87 /DNA_END=869 /DNA_ORIENTATION=+